MVKLYDLCSKDGTWDDNFNIGECSPCGEYVLHKDYLALERDYEILRKDYQSMMDKLKTTWSEG